MLPNAFIDKPKPPTTAELTAALGSAKPVWDELIADLLQAGVADQEWNTYSPKAGWSLRLKRKGRNIVYLAPCQGCFRVALILGDKAVQAARRSKLPQRVSKILDAAPRYPEGTGVRLEIKKTKDSEIVKQLAAIKLAH